MKVEPPKLWSVASGSDTGFSVHNSRKAIISVPRTSREAKRFSDGWTLESSCPLPFCCSRRSLALRLMVITTADGNLASFIRRLVSTFLFIYKGASASRDAMLTTVPERTFAYWASPTAVVLTTLSFSYGYVHAASWRFWLILDDRASIWSRSRRGRQCGTGLTGRPINVCTIGRTFKHSSGSIVVNVRLVAFDLATLMWDCRNTRVRTLRFCPWLALIH